MAVYLTAKQIAEIRGCSTQAVYKAPIPREEKTKEYDITDPKVREWTYEPYVKEYIRQKKLLEDADLEEKASQELLDQKTKEQIRNIQKQNRKLDLQYAVEKQELVPVGLVNLWIGYFDTGIRNNFLQIGNRVGRGDNKLRDRIEKEIKRAIEKTRDSAAAQLKAESEKLKIDVEEKN